MSMWNHDADPSDFLPINDRVQLFKVCDIITERLCDQSGGLSTRHLSAEALHMERKYEVKRGPL